MSVLLLMVSLLGCRTDIPKNPLADDDDGDGYSEFDGDCDDRDPLVYPGSVEEDVYKQCMIDRDGDGFGDANAPQPYTAGSDCDDENPLTFPGAAEKESETECLTDEDEDGWSAENTDCDDSDATLNQDDSDGDGQSTCESDCDDTVPTTYLGADEYCNEVDDNCDGTVDEPTALDASTWYEDADSDGFGNANVSQNACTQPSGYILDNTDCDDGAASVYPNADEYCNEVDDNCDGTVDESISLDATTWYEDADGDQFGNVSVPDVSCTQPMGYVLDNTDCDDTSNTSFPNADEYCNGRDDNCDGAVDESTALDATTWYEDADGDGFGNANVSQNACAQPSGFILDTTDCNDSSDVTFPGAAQVTSSTTCMTDADDDGHAASSPEIGAIAGTDCDDTDPNTFRGAGALDSPLLCLTDVDGDGYGSMNPVAGVEIGTDCDDTNIVLNPSDTDGDGETSCDGDCDDSDYMTYTGAAFLDDVTLCMTDFDGDGYGDDSVIGAIVAGTDCNDVSIETYPGAAAYDSPQACMTDVDGDGFGSTSPLSGAIVGTDCDDDSDVTFPGAAPNDSFFDCMSDVDGDDWGESSPLLGVIAGTDCDDGDLALLSSTNDMDCDGVLGVDDCDDFDDTKPNEDQDCDGVLSADDCDDADPLTVNDMDCDGVLSADDCDDTDPTTVDDMDCDGILSVDDCDDYDSSVMIECLEINLGGGESFYLVEISSGNFLMGSPTSELGRSGDETQHQVALTNDYLVMTTEVTQGMFAQLTGYNAHDGQGTPFGVGNQYPAHYVNWHMAADFANTTTHQHNIEYGANLQQCYTCTNSGTESVLCSVVTNPYQCTGYRLLTEAEWEYAARANTTTAYWTSNGGGDLPIGYTSTTTNLTDGSDLNSYAHSYSTFNNPYGMKPVAQLQANDFGLYDMSGNVWEWTHDWYEAFQSGLVENPVGGAVGTIKVFRGGSWGSSVELLRSATRNGDTSTARPGTVGFRLGRTSITQPSAASISISNQDPLEQVDDLYCEILVDSIDPDGNPVTYSFDWTVDGSIYNGTSTTTVYSGDTIPASETNGGEVWECTVTPNDGTEDGFTSSDSVTVASECGLTDCDVNLDLGGGQSIDMVLIPNGTFTMGSPSNEMGRDSDEIQYTVNLTNDYYVMTTEVTQGMFAQIMGYEAYDSQTTSDTLGSFGLGEDYPAYYVNWHMAADFANTVTQRHNTVNGTTLQECYSCTGSESSVTCSVSVEPYQCNGYRMLTEAEWEYAARAGTTAAFWTPNGSGNLPSGYSATTSTLTDGFDLRLYGHYFATYNNPFGSKEVAQLLPNDYGLYDMSGNLWEWTQDWYGAYSTGSVTNPTGISSSSYRVIRGGRWINGPDDLRSARRYYSTTANRSYTIGVRLSLTPLTQPSAASIGISNQDPLEQVDDLYCEILVDSIDPDGNPVTYSFDWTVDGSIYNGTSTTTVYSGDTIPASETNGGEVWECTVTPNDGTEDGFTSSDSVTVASECGLTDCDVNLDLGGGQSIDMVLIPAGDDPLGRYTLTQDFYMMTTEVTQGMFTALMSYDPTTYSTTYGVGNDYPAYYVNWHMAADFANMVTQRHNTVNGTSLQQCYSCSSSGSTSVNCTETMNPYQCSGYVLPTEAEWEYAARSGTQYDFWTPDGGGNYSAQDCNGTETIQDGVSNPLLSAYGWFCGNASSSKEVGQKLPNGFGLYDMHGNLWEWTADWWGCSYPQTSTDPYCSTAGSDRVERGGSWGYYPSYLRSSYRYTYVPSSRRSDVGFRLGLHP